MDKIDCGTMAPILAQKHFEAPSVFEPGNLLREARRQKGLPAEPVPEICLLDPDGDILRRLKAEDRARRSSTWPCYHTDLHEFEHAGERYGIIGCAVGASFAVLIAEELFACGCRFLISVTSAGQILEDMPPPYFVVIDRALRDEGTSYHYLPPAEFSVGEPGLIERVMRAFGKTDLPIRRGAVWTTDAPFRETEAAIAACRAQHIVAVEMEAAALYAFAEARQRAVLCFAHVTNRMAVSEGDFEKGEADGVLASLAVIATAARAWRGGAEPRARATPMAE
ncbi:MAG TPA: nucleoside phosphorylase [Stellaceae bacterium]|nr:nucleoside phosphorylase [Stellaceae bacterium]